MTLAEAFGWLHWAAWMAFVFHYSSTAIKLRRTRAVVRKMVTEGVIEAVLRLDPKARAQLLAELGEP